MIPAVEKLNARLAEAADPIEHAELSLERASFLARIGAFEESQAVVSDLRRQYGHEASFRLSIRYMVCEGLIAHFRGDWTDARDRFFRAHALAQAYGVPDLAALAGSWLAHVDFNLRNYESTRLHLGECLHQTGDGVAAAHLRAMIVMGDASTYCGAMSDAKRWYRNALTLAVRQGDQVSIEAIMYNRTAFRLARLRTLQALSEPDDGSGAFTSMEVSSSVSYYCALGYSSLDKLIVAIRARCALVNHQYEAAAADFEFLVRQGLTTSYQSDLVLLKAELALCLHSLGRSDAELKYTEADQSDLGGMDPDDKIVYCDIMSKLGQQLGASVETVERFRVAKQEAREQYRRELQELKGILDLECEARFHR